MNSLTILTQHGGHNRRMATVGDRHERAHAHTRTQPLCGGHKNYNIKNALGKRSEIENKANTLVSAVSKTTIFLNMCSQSDFQWPMRSSVGQGAHVAPPTF